ncbi:hypothetical protein Ddye_002017 [Dipteronia dyeriana]|uniref:Reverse transcriptase zinc-binding domain-containing protein n=1 Tax=Dipteronia dyeriana TaxID=168575 RepID=A0AAD9XR03_9ROSI|nr:hypothetical protein Ddye_002017 [Dipteronia dyeriana]
MCTDNKGIQQVVLDYFSVLFQSFYPYSEQWEEVIASISRRLSRPNSDILDLPFLAKEVKKAVFDMALMKAPGVDIMPTFFYQRHWETVGVKNTQACLNCLNNGGKLDEVNKTLITLNPKILRVHSFLADSFRIMQSSISSVFTARGLEFVRKLGFSLAWVDRIMRYVSSIDFSFLINGKVCGNLKPSRGLRQGWQNRLFLAWGKEVLLKAVVQAIPMYSMFLFRLPKVGGFKFWDLATFNQAMLAKQCWRGYKLGKMLQGSYDASVATHNVLWWMVLWKLGIPPKIRTFIWKCYHHWIPIKLSLANWRVPGEVFCPIFLRYPESTTHTLWGYKRVRAMSASLCVPPLQAAEDSAILRGMRVAVDIDLIPAVLESDTKWVVYAINDNRPSYADIGII